MYVKDEVHFESYVIN